MASLWERIKAYVSGWPIGKNEPEPEPKKSTEKKPKGLNPKKKKKKRARKQGNIAGAITILMKLNEKNDMKGLTMQ